jgi:hypothetical protein
MNPKKVYAIVSFDKYDDGVDVTEEVFSEESDAFIAIEHYPHSKVVSFVLDRYSPHYFVGYKNWTIQLTKDGSFFHSNVSHGVSTEHYFSFSNYHNLKNYGPQKDREKVTAVMTLHNYMAKSEHQAREFAYYYGWQIANIKKLWPRKNTAKSHIYNQYWQKVKPQPYQEIINA